MFTKTVHSDFSGHTLFVRDVDADKLPALNDKDAYTRFYEVRNFDEEGVVFLYLAKGYKDAPKQIVAWYPRTKAFWSGYGENFKEAIEGAQKDGWMYA